MSSERARLKKASIYQSDQQILTAIFGRFRQFFVKMGAKTISVSGFYLRFEFRVLDFINNIIHIDMVCGGLSEI